MAARQKLFNKKLFFVSIFFIIFISFASLGNCEIEVSASVDKTKISLDEFVQLAIDIKGIDNSYKNPEIKLPKIEKNFDIVANAQSNRINIQGGSVDISWQQQYTLSPKKEGSLKIESAEIIYQDKIYKTQELEIVVTPAKSPKKPTYKIPQPPPQQKIIPQQTPWSGREGANI